MRTNVLLMLLLVIVLTACSNAPSTPLPLLYTQVFQEVNERIDYSPEDPGTDIWQTCKEAFANGGDCEDSALCYRDLLLHLGVSEKHLILVAVRLDRVPGNPSHMVLLLRYKGILYVYDSRETSVYSYYSMRNLYTKLYEVRSTGVYAGEFKLSTLESYAPYARYMTQKTIESNTQGTYEP